MEFFELNYGGVKSKVTRKFKIYGRVVDIHQKDLSTRLGGEPTIS